MLTVLVAAQCVSACVVTGCHHGDSMDSMAESHQSMHHQQPGSHHQSGHQDPQTGHPGSMPSDPAQQGENCGGSTCDHTTYLAQAKDTSVLEKLTAVGPILLLPVAAPVMQIDAKGILAFQATHSPPHIQDVGLQTTVLRI